MFLISLSHFLIGERDRIETIGMERWSPRIKWFVLVRTLKCEQFITMKLLFFVFWTIITKKFLINFIAVFVLLLTISQFHHCES